MIGLGDLIHSSLAHRIGWALLHSLWQGALVGGAFWLARSAMRRCSANARYSMGCLALGLLAAMPVITFVMIGAPSTHPGAGVPSAAAILETGRGVLGLGDVELIAGKPANSFFQWCAFLLGRFAPFATLGWLLGMGILSLRLMRGYQWTRKIRTSEADPVEPAWIEMLDDLRVRFGISRPVCLLKSALVDVPTMVGWLRPVILLPAAGLVGLTPAQIEAVFAHELAHVRRWDYLANACQCLMETLMFYQPVVWWISRCVREERENCCDDLVVKICKDRLEYARALTALEELRSDLPTCALAATGGSLIGRIRRLAGVADTERPATMREVSGLVVMVFGLLIILLGVRLLMLPAIYPAVARIKVERDVAGIIGETNGGLLMGTYDPDFLQTEFEVIRSTQVLAEVVDTLDLTQAWAQNRGNGNPLRRSAAIAKLRHGIELRPVRNTSMIEIQAAAEKPDEAAMLANSVAQVYRAQRNSAADHLAIKAEILRRIEGLQIEGNAQVVVQSDLLKALRRVSQERGRLGLAQLMTEPGPEGFSQMSRPEFKDSLLCSLIEQSNLATQRLVLMEKEYGPQHVEVLKLKAQSQDLQQKITNRVDGILLGLEAKLAATKSSLSNLDHEGSKLLSDRYETALSASDAGPPHDRAALERWWQIRRLKFESEKAASHASRTLVEIIENATPSSKPVPAALLKAVSLILFGAFIGVAGRFIFGVRTARPA